jgi:hypothetical protein
MTSSVRFSSTPAPAGSTLPDLAPLLGRVLYSKHGAGSGQGQQILRAMICSAIGSGHHPNAVRFFVLGNPNAAHLIPLLDRSSWHSIVSSARAYYSLVNDAGDGARAKRLPWSRAGIARLVSPMPADANISLRMEVRLRITLAVLMSRALETGYDTLLATAGWLALEMNTTPAQAARVLAVMEGLRWIYRVRGGGMGVRYRFVKLPTVELREKAWEHNVTVDALANNEPGADPLAQLITLVREPAFAYSESLGHRAWLRLALPHVPAADKRLGLSASSYRALGKALASELPGALDGAIDLEQALQEYGEQSLAVFIREDRAIDLAALAKENLARLQAVRELKDKQFADVKAARLILRNGWDAVGRVPDGTAPGAEIKSWVDASAAHFVDSPVEPQMLEVVKEQLRGILTKRGHEGGLVTRIADYVLPDVVGA